MWTVPLHSYSYQEYPDTPFSLLCVNQFTFDLPVRKLLSPKHVVLFWASVLWPCSCSEGVPVICTDSLVESAGSIPTTQYPNMDKHTQNMEWSHPNLRRHSWHLPETSAFWLGLHLSNMELRLIVPASGRQEHWRKHSKSRWCILGIYETSKSWPQPGRTGGVLPQSPNLWHELGLP